jgi:acetoin utilization protein AcuB
MKVSQYMSQPVLSIAPNTDFHVAYELMVSRGIHHLPVVDGDKLLGIVGERDVLLAAAHFGPAVVPVEEIMRSPVVTVSASATIEHAARLLVLRRIGSLPVLNRHKAMVGIITETDMFKLTAGMLRPRPAPAGSPRKSAARKASVRKKPARKAATRKK